MELLTLIATFFVAISFLLAPCASNQVSVQKSLKQVHPHDKFTISSMPRKLKLNEDQPNVMKNTVDKDFTLAKKFIEPSSVTKQHEKEENVIHAAGKGTSWVNEEEGPNKSEYFSMDYGWVRKRRPIHNKQIPFVP